MQAKQTEHGEQMYVQNAEKGTAVEQGLYATAEQGNMQAKQTEHGAFVDETREFQDRLISLAAAGKIVLPKNTIDWHRKGRRLR